MSASNTDAVIQLLAARGPMTASELAASSGVSQPTVSRAIGAAKSIFRIGKGRQTRYALPRIAQDGQSARHLYLVNPQGQAEPFGQLHSLQTSSLFLERAPESADYAYLLNGDEHPSLFPGLPWFLDDMRPQGYLGRIFARQRGAALGLGSNPENWSGESALTAILEAGGDTPGNFILGNKAIETFQRSKLDFAPGSFSDRLSRYDALADLLSNDGELPQSSAGGEQPKFAASAVLENGEITHHLVKFSGANRNVIDHRWSDLLHAEALASETLLEFGLPAARSKAISSARRTYLEVERFDRVGRFGRKGTLSLRAIVAGIGGPLDKTWTQAASDLARLGWLSESEAKVVATLEWFGRLIGNSDMHFGNLSLRLDPQLPLSLCPTYDMLPMSYAPSRAGDLPAHAISPPLPRPEQIDSWRPAAEAAERFWETLSRSDAINEDVRTIARANRDLVTRQSQAL